MVRSTPQQARSRETEARLVGAALKLLRSGGLDACTAPAVAAESGLAVGTIYRRFADKDALLRHVFQSILDSVDTAEITSPRVPGPTSLPQFVENLVATLLCSYATDANLYFALLQYARITPDADFKAAILASAAKGRSRIATALADVPPLCDRADAPARAHFAVFACAAVLQASLTTEAVPDPDLKRHLVEMLLGFLGRAEPAE